MNTRSYDGMVQVVQILEEAFKITYGRMPEDQQAACLTWLETVNQQGIYQFFTSSMIEFIGVAVTEDLLIRKFVLSYAEHAQLLLTLAGVNDIYMLYQGTADVVRKAYREPGGLMAENVKAGLNCPSHALKEIATISPWYFDLYALFATGAYHHVTTPAQ